MAIHTRFFRDSGDSGSYEFEAIDLVGNRSRMDCEFAIGLVWKDADSGAWVAANRDGMILATGKTRHDAACGAALAIWGREQ